MSGTYSAIIAASAARVVGSSSERAVAHGLGAGFVELGYPSYMTHTGSTSMMTFVSPSFARTPLPARMSPAFSSPSSVPLRALYSAC